MISIKRFILFCLAIILVASALPTKSSQAAPVVGFNAGNIMDDSVFVKRSSMTANQIKSFLTSKGVSCTTGNCLKNYTQNGKSSARIIYEAAQDYRINPQVLIVLIQKETGLVTINNPASWRYRTATGYGCPDGEPCNSEYYGFTNQVRQAARMFRNIMNENPNWYTPYTIGSNRIYWHPDLSRCGSSTVNIVNLTTVALYSYTPYRPNSAALNAGYGTGNSCSSYGNRNFYQYFKDWFGSVRGAILPYRLISCGEEKYLIERGKRMKRLLTSEAVTAIGVATSAYLSNDVGCSYPSYAIPLSRSFRSRTTSKVYVSDSKNAYRLHGVTVAKAWGLMSTYTASISTLPQLNGPVINALFTAHSRMPYLATSTTTTRTYLADDGKRYLVAGTPEDNASLRLITGYDLLSTATFTPEFIQTLQDRGTLDYSFSVNGSLYLFDHGKVRKIKPTDQTRWENALEPIALTDGVLRLLPQSSELSRGFRRDNLYYRVTLGGNVESTTNTTTASSWSVNNSPVITNLLRNKLTQ